MVTSNPPRGRGAARPADWDRYRAGKLVIEGKDRLDEEREEKTVAWSVPRDRKGQVAPTQHAEGVCPRAVYSHGVELRLSGSMAASSPSPG